jgi:hypothetical protein
MRRAQTREQFLARPVSAVLYGASVFAAFGKVQIEPILGNTTDLRRPHPLRCVSIPGRFAQRLFTHESGKPEQFSWLAFLLVEKHFLVNRIGKVVILEPDGGIAGGQAEMQSFRRVG